jgi:hypothetical protein
MVEEIELSHSGGDGSLSVSLGHHSHATIERVEFSLFMLLAHTGLGVVLADQDPQQHFWVNRGSTGFAVGRTQLLPTKSKH